MKKIITNGFKLISRLDRDIGVLIDNCLGFLYSLDLGHDMRRDLGQIEAALYDVVYLGRTQAGCEFKENLFRRRILPLMKHLAPAGYYFGIDPDHTDLLGYWQQPDAEVNCGSCDLLDARDDSQVVPSVNPVAD